MKVRDDAHKDWLSGMKYQEIADKYGVSLSTVKSWASRYWKTQKQKKVATKEEKRLQPSGKKSQPKKPGGQPGNQNAKGNSGGAPPGSKNNFRHGFYYDALEPEEQAFVNERSPITEAERLLNELDLCEIKERRLMRKLAELRAVPTGLAAQSVTKSKDGTSTTAVSTNEYILRYDSLLTQAQRAHVRCIQALHSTKMDIEKLQLAKLQAGIGPDSAEDEATQKALLKSITEAIGDDH